MDDGLLRIYKYGEAVLALKAREIQNIDQKLVDLVKGMPKTMYQWNGIGLAAPQVGKSIRLAIVDLSSGENPDQMMVLINPEILESSGNVTDDEGCLSVPGITLPVTRNKSVYLKYLDINGNEIKQEFEDFHARVIQHEIDHLDGVVIVDRVSSLKRQLTKKQIKKLKENGEW